jgi:hypothetical protein
MAESGSGPLAKAMHLSDEDEQSLRNARAALRSASGHMDKITFEDRTPQGSDLEGRTAADANAPSKRTIARDLTKRLGWLVRDRNQRVALAIRQVGYAPGGDAVAGQRVFQVDERDSRFADEHESCR